MVLVLVLFVGVFYSPNLGFLFLRIIIKISFLMSLNISNFSIFEALSHEATDIPFYCESFLNSTFALLLLLTLWILSLFPYHSSLHCSDFISQRASSIFYGHHEGIKRTKEKKPLRVVPMLTMLEQELRKIWSKPGDVETKESQLVRIYHTPSLL